MAKIRKIILAAAAVTAVAAGSAFTDSITGVFPTTGNAAYAKTTITGAVSNSVAYTYSTDLSTVTNAQVVFRGRLEVAAGVVIQGGFGQDLGDLSATVVVTNYDAEASPNDLTTVTFTPSTALTTEDLTNFHVLVTGTKIVVLTQ
jgi:hypothetical protein